MQNNSNAVTADKAQMKTGPEKVSEKIAEKRRALGRGLESLLPGPRVVKPVSSPSAVESGPSDSAQSRTAEAAPASPPSPATEDLGLGVQTAQVSAQTTGANLGHTRPLGPSSSSSSSSSSLSSSAVVAELQAADSGAVVQRHEVVWLGIDLIDENPHQTRRVFNEGVLEELAQSIRVHGVLQPIVVRPKDGGRYLLVLGERRLRASRLALQDTIPAVVRRLSEQRAAEMTLVENLQRQDLNCVEQAEAFANLSQKFMLTQEQIGAQVGVARETVANYMRLLTLGDGIIGALQKGQLTYSHARALLMVDDTAVRWKYAQRAIEEKMSVAQLEDLVQGLFVPRGVAGERKGTGARWVDPNVKAAQRSLEEVLGMRVRIRDRQGRGKIQISYETIDDFDRVVRMLRGK